MSLKSASFFSDTAGRNCIKNSVESAVNSPLKKPPGGSTGPTTHADSRGNIIGRVPSRGQQDVFGPAVNAESGELQFPDWSGMDDFSARVSPEVAFQLCEQYAPWFPDTAAMCRRCRPEKCLVATREGTRPTSACRPGPLTRRRGLMTLCIAGQTAVQMLSGRNLAGGSKFAGNASTCSKLDTS